MKKLFIYIDGASKGNPGKAGYGFLIYDEKKNLVEKSGGFLGITTNNVAEYFALIFSLPQGPLKIMLLSGKRFTTIVSESTSTSSL